MTILSELNLHPCLRSRIHRIHPAPSAQSSNKKGGFVLYLPTVLLRYEQNPAFAVATHAANKLHVPLVVLAVVVDDASHSCSANPHRCPLTTSDTSNNASSSSVVMTSRRLAFTLQALSQTCTQWSEHGAAVGIRIHASNNPINPNCKDGKVTKGARTPDHLTIATRANFVVTDEPFVSPYTTFVHRVEEACRKANVECYRVDGSCTVPPIQVLKKRNTNANHNNNNGIMYDGVPAKAYLWQKKTEHIRESHLNAAMDGHFDALDLNVKVSDDILFGCSSNYVTAEGKQEEDDDLSSPTVDNDTIQNVVHLFPSRWKATPADNNSQKSTLPSAPDVRPFTSRELSDLYTNGLSWGDKDTLTGSDDAATMKRGDDNLPFHNFALNWPGADLTVPPCKQTIGTTSEGNRRWNQFAVQNEGLNKYGKQRNDAKLVHSVSRMSAFLNLGIVSIFRLVWEVKRAQKLQSKKKASNGKTTKSKWDKSGADKYEEEIVKWREMSYAHAFSRSGDYDNVSSLPHWSVTCLNNHQSGRRGHTLQQLANGRTGDTKWDAMQRYLVRTGELHNNVRMTWGKTVVEWVGCSDRQSTDTSAAQVTLQTLCYLNDRYALDALSPPSYAGLLWCMGWTDKPSVNSGWTIALKPAQRYRMTAQDFQLAEEKLLTTSIPRGVGNSAAASSGIKRQPSLLDMIRMQPNKSASVASSTTADSQTQGKSTVISNNKGSGVKRKRSVLDMLQTAHSSDKK